LSNLPLVGGKGYGASALQSKEPARATRAETSTAQRAGVAGLTRGGRECNRECVVRLSTSRSLAGIPLPSRLAFNEKLCEARWRKRARSGRQVSATGETVLAAAGSHPSPSPFGVCTVGKSGRSSRVLRRQSRRPQERAIPNKQNRERTRFVWLPPAAEHRARVRARMRARG